MATTILIGAQWGDEGKGKITDYLAAKSEVVVRFQGGNNAGHTVIDGENEYKLHLIPSGILSADCLCIIGNGVVIDLEALLAEMDGLIARGLSFKNFYISDRAHLIMPYHKVLDGLEEADKADGKIGTTKRGIGPAYMDKIGRIGIRVCDLLDEEEFRRKLRIALREKNRLLEKIYERPPLAEDEIVAEFLPMVERIRPHVADTSLMLFEAIRAGKPILFEGAQGAHLDIDHGTYPYVTSSNPVSGGALTGTGIGPTAVDRVVGVSKAYTTRVGEGPFPTELLDEMGETLQKAGGEYGVTTGRPRRCGWLDCVVLRHSIRVAGITDLVVTKLDVLDALPEVKICTAYTDGDKVYKEFPAALNILNRCQPVYETLPGWQQDTTGIRRFEDLPAAAQRYITRIEELTGGTVTIVAVGPERNQIILRKDF